LDIQEVVKAWGGRRKGSYWFLMFSFQGRRGREED